MVKNDYSQYKPVYWWDTYNCYVLDSWYDENGVRHHTCLGEHIEDGMVLSGAIIHKG